MRNEKSINYIEKSARAFSSNNLYLREIVQKSVQCRVLLAGIPKHLCQQGKHDGRNRRKDNRCNEYRENRKDNLVP